MAASQTSALETALPVWEQLFYDGDRLSAEVTLLAAAFVDHSQSLDLAKACAQIHRSHGSDTSHQPLNAFAAFQARQPEPSTPTEAWKQLLPVADLPDALLFWVLDACPLGRQSRISAFACCTACPAASRPSRSSLSGVDEAPGSCSKPLQGNCFQASGAA